MSFFCCLMDYFGKMQAFRQASGFNIKANAVYLMPFIEYCGEKYINATGIDQEMIDEWIAVHKYRTSSTKSVFISCLRQFTRFINATGGSAHIPSTDYNVVRERFIPHIFTDKELSALFYTIDSIKKHSEDWPRDYILPVLFRMIYCCGMRPSEPLRLKTEDVNLKTGDIFIRQSKGSKDRHLLMSQDLLELCRVYDVWAGERLLFFQRHDGRPLPIYWLDRQFHVCWHKSGITGCKKPRPYDLRHSFATRNLIKWLDLGLDAMVMLPYLSAYMGHTHFQHTMYYVHLLPENLRKTKGVDWERLNAAYGDNIND